MSIILILINYNYKDMAINIGLFHVGEAIKERMKSLKMTQADFAEILKMTQPSVNAMLKKPSMDTLRKVYQLVPMQDFSKAWADEELFKKYGITDEEIAFIDSVIKPIE